MLSLLFLHAADEKLCRLSGGSHHFDARVNPGHTYQDNPRMAGVAKTQKANSIFRRVTSTSFFMIGILPTLFVYCFSAGFLCCYTPITTRPIYQWGCGYREIFFLGWNRTNGVRLYPSFLVLHLEGASVYH
jgi:hypothetical protein